MRILFVQTNTYPLLHPLPIGPALVARRLQTDGHEVRFVDLMGERDPVGCARAAARECGPDLCCYSVRNRDSMSAARYFDPMPVIAAVAAAVREVTAAPALVGGTAFTTWPERVLELLGAEYGLAGDDLAQVTRFVASLAAGAPDLATPGLVYRGADGQVVANPFALVGYRGLSGDHHALIDHRRYRAGFWQAAVITRSGCPERCIYCDTFHTFGREFVLREPEAVAEELLALKRTGRVRAVWLVDAGFNRPLDHAKAVLEAILRRGAQLQLYAVFDPGPADAEFFRLFRRAGGALLTMFVESLSDPVLVELAKSFTIADALRDAAAMRRERIGIVFMPTFGSPGETPQTVAQTLARVPQLAPTVFDASVGWRLEPRTALHDRAVAEGLITPDDDGWEPRFYVSPHTPREWLTAELKRFRRRHWWLGARILPFALRALCVRPWTWGPES